MASSDLTPAPRPEGLAAAREQMVARLGESFARDALTLEEYERRLSLVYEAATPDSLAAIVADLPAASTVLVPQAAAPRRIVALLSSVVRGGPGAVPGELSVRSWLGNVEMDLRDATFPEGVTEIRLDVVLGNVEIDLPRHVRVEDESSTILASFENRRGRTAEPGAAVESGSVVRFSGKVVLGNVEVRAR